MVAVVLARDRWTRQPQIPVGLDPHWLQYDPVHIITGRSWLNRVGRAKFNTPVAMIRHPLGLKTTYNSSGLGSQSALCNSPEGMMLWAGTISSSTEYKPSIMSLDHADSGSPDWIGLRAYDTWNNTMYAGMRLGASNVKTTNLGTPANEGMIVSGGKHGWFVAKGGRTIASDPAETRWSSSFNTQTATAVWINYMNYGASSTSSYPYLIAAFFNRQPPLEEQRALSRNPWILFWPAARAIFSLGSAGVTISANVGDAAAAGATATVATNVTVAAGVGDAVAQGLQANVASNVTIPAGVGNAVADGSPAAISNDTQINASVGNAVAAGATASIDTGGSVTISCSVGNAVAAGLAANVASDVTIAAGIGDAVAAGATATVETRVTINANVGDAQAAGLTATVESPVTIACGVGAAVAAGATATISAGGELTAAEIATTVWNELMVGTTSARDIMSAMADFLRERHYLPPAP